MRTDHRAGGQVVCSPKHKTTSELEVYAGASGTHEEKRKKRMMVESVHSHTNGLMLLELFLVLQAALIQYLHVIQQKSVHQLVKYTQ